MSDGDTGNWLNKVENIIETMIRETIIVLKVTRQTGVEEQKIRTLASAQESMKQNKQIKTTTAGRNTQMRFKLNYRAKQTKKQSQHFTTLTLLRSHHIFCHSQNSCDKI